MRNRILILFSLILIVFAPPPSSARNVGKQLYIAFIDVGQGDCEFLRTPSGHTILIDGGGRANSKDGSDIGSQVVLPFLRHQGVSRLDLVVLTHPHDDHIQGLLPVIKTMRVGRVLDIGIPMASDAYRQYLRTIRKKKIPYTRAVRGQSIDLRDGVTAQVLNPPARKRGYESTDLNNESIVLRFVYGKRAFLFMGDAGFDVEDEILSAGLDVRSDVIKIGHHGSRFSTGEAFLDRCKPEAAVISVGRNNTFGHPARETLRKLTDRGILVFRTDRNGAAIVKCSADGAITVLPTKQPRRRTAPRPRTPGVRSR